MRVYLFIGKDFSEKTPLFTLLLLSCQTWTFPWPRLPCVGPRGEQSRPHSEPQQSAVSSPADEMWVSTLLALLSTLTALTEADCDLPLGLQSGEISDSQLRASSSFTSAVGATMARLDSEEGGGAWCPSGLVSQQADTKQWLEVNLGRRLRISGLALQGRWGGGQGAEWTPEVTLSWHDVDRDVFVQSSQVYPANTDTYSTVNIRLEEEIETDVIRVIPVSQHPRAVCLRLELYGCQLDSLTDTDGAADTVTIMPDIGDTANDDRKEIREETVTDYDLVTAITDHNIFPVVLALLALISVVLIILSVLLLRKISNSRKQVQLPASEVHYYQNTLQTLQHNCDLQPQHHKKNIYEVPKVEPIYSTPIEIFFPSSPSSLSTDSSECETFRAKSCSPTTSTPAQPHHDCDSFKSPAIQRFEDLVTFSPIYSYFTTPAEPKYSNIV